MIISIKYCNGQILELDIPRNTSISKIKEILANIYFFKNITLSFDNRILQDHWIIHQIGSFENGLQFVLI